MTTPEDVDAAVRANYEAQRAAMVAGDADVLGELLAQDFTLTHMTGYEQSERFRCRPPLPARRTALWRHGWVLPDS